MQRREQRDDVLDVGSAETGATRVKRCGSISTSRSSRSRVSASRTGVRLSPSQPQSSSSWSASPGTSVPSTIASQSFAYAVSRSRWPIDRAACLGNWHIRFQ